MANLTMNPLESLIRRQKTIDVMGTGYKSLSLINRYGNEYKVFPMMCKDGPGVAKLLPQSLNAVMLSNVASYIYNGAYDQVAFDIEDQFYSLCDLLATYIAKTDIETILANFDLEMAKAAVKNYIDIGGNCYMDKVIQCGTKVIDREGAEFTAYSYKLTDYPKAMELLGKIDFTSTAANYDPVSYNAMIEIIYLALNEKVDIEVIEKSIDAEFARKVLAVYYDVTGLFEQAQ
jgi:hypothetical protein